MKLPPAVQAEIDNAFIDEQNRQLLINVLERIAALAVRETAMECAELVCTYGGYDGCSIAADEILSRYEVTR
mgnify:CR=1 FL=1